MNFSRIVIYSILFLVFPNFSTQFREKVLRFDLINIISQHTFSIDVLPDFNKLTFGNSTEKSNPLYGFIPESNFILFSLLLSEIANHTFSVIPCLKKPVGFVNFIHKFRSNPIIVLFIPQILNWRYWNVFYIKMLPQCKGRRLPPKNLTGLFLLRKIWSNFRKSPKQKKIMYELMTFLLLFSFP